MKKIIHGIILILTFVLLGGYSEVYGVGFGTGSNIGGGKSSTFVSCGNRSTFCWNSAPASKGKRVQAIRVSIVDKNGNRWPGTISLDYFKYDDAENKKIFEQLADRKNTNFYKQRYTRNEIVTQYLNSTLERDPSGNYTTRDGIVKLEKNAFPNYNGVGANVLKPYFLNFASSKEDFIDTYLTPLGFDYEKELEKQRQNSNHFKNIALLIEPVVYFRLTSNRGGDLTYSISYAGTVTEVAHMMSQDKDYNYNGPDSFFDLIRPNKSYRGIHFSSPTAFDIDYPLAIYVDTATKQYGLMGVKHWVDANKMTNYSAEILTTNGVGAGHVSFDELFCPAPDKITDEDLPLCCSELVAADAYNSSNYSKCCKELYEAGKITSSHLPTCCHVLPKTHPLWEKECYSPPPIEEQCEWEIDVSCPDKCTNKTKGYVKDKDDWDCIFESRNASRSNIRTHYYVDEFKYNPYCDYYCREEVNYQLPKSGFTVLAGNHFTVGYESSDSWSPIRFEGISECRTTSDIKKIKHEQFQKDYDEANRRLPALWEEYKKQQILEISRDEALRSSVRNCDYYCDYNVHGLNCCRDADRDWDDCKYGSPNQCVGGIDDDGKYNPCLYTINTCRGGWGPWYCVEDDTPYYHGYMKYPQPTTRGDFGPYTARSWCTTNGSGNERTREPSGVKAAANAYYNMLELRDSYLLYLEKCNDWQRNYDHFEPQVRLNFEEDMYKINNLELEPSVSGQAYSDYYVGNSYSRDSYFRVLTTPKYVCKNFDECYEDELIYPANDNVRQYTQRVLTYHLPTYTYRYVTKPSGVSTSFKPFGQYVDIGYGNLPVHYSREPGKYDISLSFSSFGSNHKFNPYVFSGVSFNGNYQDIISCSTNYECNYRVINEYMECLPGEVCEKLNVIFRQVSLTNPFPGEDGNGRTPGWNWRWDVSLITNNRGLSNPERIYYDREPMYQITLTPRLIMSIRSYNRSQDGGYGDFNLTCIQGTGRECKSEFIREEFSNYFSGCGLNSDWNACD